MSGKARTQPVVSPCVWRACQTKERGGRRTSGSVPKWSATISWASLAATGFIAPPAVCRQLTFPRPVAHTRVGASVLTSRAGPHPGAMRALARAAGQLRAARSVSQAGLHTSGAFRGLCCAWRAVCLTPTPCVTRPCGRAAGPGQAAVLRRAAEGCRRRCVSRVRRWGGGPRFLALTRVVFLAPQCWTTARRPCS